MSGPSGRPPAPRPPPTPTRASFLLDPMAGGRPPAPLCDPPAARDRALSRRPGGLALPGERRLRGPRVANRQPLDRLPDRRSREAKNGVPGSTAASSREAGTLRPPRTRSAIGDRSSSWCSSRRQPYSAWPARRAAFGPLTPSSSAGHRMPVGRARKSSARGADARFLASSSSSEDRHRQEVAGRVRPPGGGPPAGPFVGADWRPEIPAKPVEELALRPFAAGLFHRPADRDHPAVGPAPPRRDTKCSTRSATCPSAQAKPSLRPPQTAAVVPGSGANPAVPVYVRRRLRDPPRPLRAARPRKASFAADLHAPRIQGYTVPRSREPAPGAGRQDLYPARPAIYPRPREPHQKRPELSGGVQVPCSLLIQYAWPYKRCREASRPRGSARHQRGERDSVRDEKRTSRRRWRESMRVVRRSAPDAGARPGAAASQGAARRAALPRSAPAPGPGTSP